MRFPSRKDWWLTIIIWGSMLYLIGVGGYTLIFEDFSMGRFILVLICLFLVPLFLLWMWLRTYYVIEEEQLIIKFGPFKKVIPINTIISVKKTMNPFSSPALSIKRIEILYGHYEMVLISPYDRDEFIDILKKRCPQIKEINS